MSDVDEEVKPGQFWRHVGGEGVPGTGLVVQIRDTYWSHFLAVYPPEPRSRRFGGRTLGRYYEQLSPAQARKAILGGVSTESVTGGDRDE